MASNELMALWAAPGAGESILDLPMREVFRRAALHGDAHPRLSNSWFHLSSACVPLLSSMGDMALLPSSASDGFQILDFERSDIASMARFGHRVELASYCVYVAFDKAHIADFEPTAARSYVKPKHGKSIWYSQLVNTTFNRYRDLKRALLHHWTPPAEVEPLTICAFKTLSEITPAESQLRDLFFHDRSRAYYELTRHLDLVVDQLRAAFDLANDLETVGSDEASAEDRARLEAVQTELLQKAGAALSLTEASKRLGVTRQALHKRISAGTALGLMLGSELVVPEAQFVAKDGKLSIMSGLSDVVRLFDGSGAGRWSALQFLVEVDPNLGRSPLEALEVGERNATVHAARAFLGLDEA